MGLLSKVKRVARKLDPTTLPAVGSYVKQAVVTSAVGLTGGAVLLARPDLKKTAIEGYKTGAKIGAAIGGSAVLQAAANAGTKAAPAAAPAPAAAQVEPAASPATPAPRGLFASLLALLFGEGPRA